MFEEAAGRYLDHCKTDKAPNTYIKEHSRMNCQWLPEFRNKYVDQITPLDVQNWKARRLKDGIRSHTLYNELKVLKTMFARLKDWGLYDGENPVIKLPKTVRRKIVVLTPEEVQRYLDFCSDRYYPIAATLVFTGIRKGELLSLRWSDVDLMKMIIAIRADSSLKNSKGREIPINSQLVPILRQLKRTSEWVFTGKDGKSQLSTFDKSHRTARKKAGLHSLTIHTLRHTFASLALQAGFDVGAVSKLLGHSSIRVTMEIYHHLNTDHARRVVEGLPIKLTKNDTDTCTTPVQKNARSEDQA